VIMSTAANAKTAIPKELDARVFLRVIEEGYGPGAWHGADLKAALADLSSELAFWRPASGRHNIAEIALHHAYCTRAVGSQLSGTPPEPFLLEGDDWFALPDQTRLAWSAIQPALETEQQRLLAVVAGIDRGRVQSPLTEAERFDLVLGITCHAVYHAGQVQLIKRLHAR
jgi:DinB superfamily